MHDGDFEAKPTVLFLGQYSTGKTTFIEYLLEQKVRSLVAPSPRRRHTG
jgi:signal recognition particle receptor subunit beta